MHPTLLLRVDDTFDGLLSDTFVGLLSSIPPTSERSMGSKTSEGCTSNESLVTRLGGRCEGMHETRVFFVADVSMLPVSLGIGGALARRDSSLSIQTSLFEYRENASCPTSMKTDLRLDLLASSLDPPS